MPPRDRKMKTRLVGAFFIDNGRCDTSALCFALEQRFIGISLVIESDIGAGRSG
jgi:hypothetical protein